MGFEVSPLIFCPGYFCSMNHPQIGCLESGGKTRTARAQTKQISTFVHGAAVARELRLRRRSFSRM